MHFSVILRLCVWPHFGEPNGRPNTNTCISNNIKAYIRCTVCLREQ